MSSAETIFPFMDANRVVVLESSSHHGPAAELTADPRALKVVNYLNTELLYSLFGGADAHHVTTLFGASDWPI